MDLIIFLIHVCLPTAQLANGGRQQRRQPLDPCPAMPDKGFLVTVQPALFRLGHFSSDPGGGLDRQRCLFDQFCNLFGGLLIGTAFQCLS